MFLRIMFKLISYYKYSGCAKILRVLRSRTDIVMVVVVVVDDRGGWTSHLSHNYLQTKPELKI